MAKRIKLTKGKYAIVDNDSFELIKDYKWRAKKDKNTYYAYSRHRVDGKRKHIAMHRLIMNAQPRQIIDHIDKNGLNNKKSNLRFCNTSQNAANHHPRGKSKYLGVCPKLRKWKTRNGKEKSRQVWVAQLTMNYKRMFFKYFETEIESAKAYNEVAIKYHGKFANLNILK
ncbi:MAG: hypothetical protein AABY22_09275 [Nanoarchaeota archaeon]